MTIVHSRHDFSRIPRRRLLPGMILTALSVQCFPSVGNELGMSAAAMAPVQFDSEFLVAGGARDVDITRFEQGNVVLPGTYRVDIHVNRERVTRTDVVFQLRDGSANADACFDLAQFEQLGIDTARLSEGVRAQLSMQGHCLPLQEAIADASAAFDFNAQRMDLSVPQVSLLHRPRGYVNPDAWDVGIKAAMVGYNLNVYSQNSDGLKGIRTQGHLGLNLGFNAGAWRLRHDGAYRFDNQGERDYQSIASYAKRDIPSLSAQLTIGEAYTAGEFFEANAFRGVRLESDDRMLPESLRGYAPTVRGVANSNAKVTIRQNGVVLHESTVAPGAFEISDLYATGYGGDLEVTVMEADGSSHAFSVPFAAVPLSLRPGSHRFSVVAGSLRDAQLDDSPLFVQGTWQRGMSNLATGYTGATIAPDYASAMVGVALNTRIGAIGADLTQSFTRRAGSNTVHGASYRLSFSRDLPATGTNISIAAYRYSTEGFHDLGQAMRLSRSEGQTRHTGPQQRHRASMTLGHRLGEGNGRLHATASMSDYWNRDGSDLNYTFGYSGMRGRVGYNLSASRQYQTNGRADTQYYASVSIPLGGKRRQTLTSNVMHQDNGRNQAQATLSGSAGTDSRLSYGVTARHGWGGETVADTGGSMNLTYRGSQGEVSASAAAGNGYSQASLGLRGALVLHPGGWTLSQPLSETFGIAEVPDAHGARMLNASGVKVNRRGYAVIPHLTPYRLNTVEVDPKGLSTDVELQVSSRQVVPRAGAVALVKFATTYGRSAVLEVKRGDGAVLPFGANVLDENDQEIGVVGQAGRIFARGLKEQGRLTVRWSDAETSVCSIDYVLPQRQDTAEGIQTVSGSCQPG